VIGEKRLEFLGQVEGIPPGSWRGPGATFLDRLEIVGDNVLEPHLRHGTIAVGMTQGSIRVGEVGAELLEDPVQQAADHLGLRSCCAPMAASYQPYR
jgi:hypothetical protein